jgi:hypothetical protein
MRIDPNAYLSDETMRWCERAMQQLGHSQPPSANEFLPAIRRFLVPPWYRQLRILARDHVDSGEAPELAIAPKPDNRTLWQARQEVATEMRNEADTFRLIEGGDLNSDEEEEGDWDY